MAKKAQQKTATTGRQAILRIPGIATLAVAVLTVCVTPAAFAVPGLQALYLVPIALFVWILRTRTVADARGLTVRTVFGQRELPWSELKGLSLSKRGKVSAVTTAGEEVALPTVRTRHLPVLSLVSEGRVGDPTGLTEDMDTTSESPSTGQE
ncbi:PH domain-containing protein [Amycolatopsis aidingensis]|uniref:PH domain-containing protein n=1 Tax=Amycolatopsis aidingensis TaxID=2842453 RepID=UPI001E5329F6|nr:PH domain-containing protein [Amycolatopsis aidingensis]